MDPISNALDCTSAASWELNGSTTIPQSPPNECPVLDYTITAPSFDCTISNCLTTDATFGTYGLPTPPYKPSNENTILMGHLCAEGVQPPQGTQVITNEESPAAWKKQDSSSRTGDTLQISDGISLRCEPTSASQQKTDPNIDTSWRRRGRLRSKPNAHSTSSRATTYPVTRPSIFPAREIEFEKNRLAAKKFRQRQKEFVRCLESSARQAMARNTDLKQQVACLKEDTLNLKNEVLRHAGCGFGGIDEYLIRCAERLQGRTFGNLSSKRPEESNEQFAVEPAKQEIEQ